MNQKQHESATNSYEPLLCNKCGENLLGAVLGNCVFAQINDWAVLPRYVDIYWVCKGQCDKLVQATLRDKGYSAPWQGIDDLTNPLEYRRWVEATSRLIERGEISKSAAAKVVELKRIVGPIADKETTQEEIARFWQLRRLDNL